MSFTIILFLSFQFLCAFPFWREGIDDIDGCKTKGDESGLASNTTSWQELMYVRKTWQIKFPKETTHTNMNSFRDLYVRKINIPKGNIFLRKGFLAGFFLRRAYFIMLLKLDPQEKVLYLGGRLSLRRWRSFFGRIFAFTIDDPLRGTGTRWTIPPEAMPGYQVQGHLRGSGPFVRRKVRQCHVSGGRISCGAESCWTEDGPTLECLAWWSIVI